MILYVFCILWQINSLSQTDRSERQRTDSIGRPLLNILTPLWGKVDCVKRPVRWSTVLLKDEELA